VRAAALLLALALPLPGAAADLACPAGAALAGAAWPEGQEQWCEKPDDAGRPQRHGPQRSWYDDGGPQSASSWKMGRLDGHFVEYHRNGRKAREGDWRDGEKEGRWTVWFEDGKPAEEAGYEKGILHGRFSTFFPGGGKRVEGRYCHGIQCGRWTTWDEGGRELGRMEHEEIRSAP
jgi:antitoxin component YwqK of YwqJK toxin-antitoxin module